MLKKLPLSILALLFMATSLSAAVVAPPAAVDRAAKEAFFPVDAEITPEDFLALTPRKIREATGKKLSLKQVVGLKIAQKQMKKQIKRANKGHKKAGDEVVPKGLFIVCAIFLPIAAVIFMGIMDDWEGNTWWVALLLYALCYFPGLIYTLTKMKNYY